MNVSIQTWEDTPLRFDDVDVSVDGSGTLHVTRTTTSSSPFGYSTIIKEVLAIINKHEWRVVTKL